MPRSLTLFKSLPFSIHALNPRPLTPSFPKRGLAATSIALCLRPHTFPVNFPRSFRPTGSLASASTSGKNERRRPKVVSSSQSFEVGINGSSGEGGDGDSRPARLLTLPTILTIGRVAAVPLIVSTFYMNGSWATSATTTIFVIAAVTDWLDGYIARKMQLKSSFGAFLDPVADKLMVAATLVLLCTRPLEVSIFGEVPWLLTIPSIAIIGREITMSALREWAASQNPTVLEAVAVNNLGKWKTATQMIALTILLATRDPSLTGTEVAVASGVSLLYASAGLAIWSLVVYTRNMWRALSK